MDTTRLRDQLARDVQLAGGGDIAAFRRIYHATSRKLFGIVVRILGRGEVAEEVLQEVYLKIWQQAAGYQPSIASPITWMATIARNRALDETRRRRMASLDEVPKLLELPSDEDIVAEHLDREMLSRLRTCLDRLDPGDREVVQQVYLHGLTREEAASLTGKTVPQVRYVISAGLKKLKDCLDS